MHPRAQSLIADLDLQLHPEGGYYREIFRSESRVITAPRINGAVFELFLQTIFLSHSSQLTRPSPVGAIHASQSSLPDRRA